MKIYNTLTKRKEEFIPLEEGKVKMYVCGPTVYNFIHIGNARPMIVFDTVRRYMEYKGYEVNYVSNFTDVDDKIIAKAIEEGVSAEEISTRYIKECKKDMADMNVKPATTHPLATQEIDGMIEMIQTLIDKGFAYESEGALVVDVKEESDTAPIPPCIILKSDGSAIYETTDLATLVQREKDFAPDRVIYVVDKRQNLHFERVFRCAQKTGVVKPETELSFIGFGTVNGKDGKPFKTRAGGTMKLSELLDTVENQVNIKDGDKLSEQELTELRQIIGLAAIKYGDLMNPCESNYIFDIDKFASFEGNTGPYILYTMVRIKSILAKLREHHAELMQKLEQSPAQIDGKFETASQRELALTLTRFSHTINEAYKKDAPSMICSYIYEISNKFNVFYHDKKILAETNETVLSSLVGLITLTLKVLDICINILGFKAPRKM